MPLLTKFFCSYLVTKESKNQVSKEYEVTLHTVYKDGEADSENSKFYECAPGGHIALTVYGESAGSYFKVGEEYYITFSQSEEKE